MITRSLILRTGALALLLLCSPATAEPEAALKVTVLYDNTAARRDYKADWGFAALVEGTEKTILFDTGTKGDILSHNLGIAGADLSRTGAIVISHAHGDHTGGLNAAIPKMPGVTAYLPGSSPPSLLETVTQAGGIVVTPKGPQSVCRSVWLTGELGEQIREQALVVGTAHGLVVLTGCSHPGIMTILEKAVEVGNQKVYAVMGGFHLLQHSDAAVAELVRRFRDFGVQKVGASHCTGERAMEAFRKAYGQNFIELGAGRMVSID